MVSALVLSLVLSQTCTTQTCGTFIYGGPTAQSCACWGGTGGCCRFTNGCSCETSCAYFGDCCVGANVCLAPVVWTATTVPTAGGTLTLSGSFGTTQGTVSFNGQPCGVSSWKGQAISCSTDAGVGMNLPVTVTTPNGTSNSVASYEAPVLTTLAPAVLSTVGGQVFLTGTSFGTSAASVTLGGQVVPVTSQTDRAITVTAPAGVGVNLPVVLSVAQQTSSTLMSFSYAAPVLTSVTPATMPPGGATITVSGTGFGPFTAQTPTVTVGGVACTNVIRGGDTSLTCLAPTGLGSARVVVTVAGQSSAQALAVTYPGPVVGVVTPPTVPTSGGLVTFTGTTLNAPGLSLTVNGQPCAVSGTPTPTTYACVVPAGQGVNLPVELTLGAQTFGVVPRVSYAAPQVNAVSPPSPLPTVGATLTVVGNNFGTSGTVTVGGMPCSVVSWSHTLITCALPAGSGASLPVLVTVAAQVSPTVFVSYAAPSIAVVSAVGATTAGGVLTLQGQNFGPTGGTVSVDGVPCQVGLPRSQTTVTCTLKPGAGGTVPVVFTINGATASTFFTWPAPTLTGVAPALPTSGQAALSLLGTNLGNGQATSVTVGGMPCPVAAVTHTLLVCTAPAGQGHVNVVVTVNGVSVTLPHDYLPPTLSSVSVSVSGSGTTAGGGSLVLSGANLGLTGAMVTVGGQACPVTAQTHTQVTCTLPAGQGTSLPVVLTRDALSSNSVPFSYDAPTLTSLFASAAPTSGGVNLTLYGTSLGTTGATVSVGGVDCPVTLQGHAAVTCALPAGVGTGLPVVLMLGGRSSNALSLSYDAPALTLLQPGARPTAGGTTVVLTGSNLGASQGQVTIGGAPCTITAQLHTQVSCTLAAGQGQNLPIVFTLLGRTAGGTALTLSYDAPGLTSVQASTRPTAGGVSLALLGTNLGSSLGQVTVGGVPCPVTAQAHTQVTCTLPAGQGENLPVGFSLLGRTAGGLTLSYDAPTLTSVSGARPTAGGSLLTLAGTNLGTSTATVTVGGAACPVQSQSHSQVTCTWPVGQGTGLPVVLTLLGRSSNALTVSYDAPVLTALSGPRPTAGGSTLLLFGSSLGASGATVTVGGVSCPVTAQAHTQVACTLPTGQGDAVPVVLTVAGQVSNPLTTSYDAPTVTSVSGLGPTLGGTALTVVGTNFGSSGAVVTVGGNVCATRTQAHTQVTCTLPAGQGTNLPVVVTQGLQHSNSGSFSYDAPVLTAVSPGTVSTRAGQLLLVEGHDLGTSPVASLGAMSCQVMRQTAGEVVCAVAQGAAGTASLQVTAGGQVSNSLLVTRTAACGVDLADGMACDDGNPCTATGVCVGTRCVAPAANEGQACVDADPCSADGLCQAGRCLGQTPARAMGVACATNDPCRAVGVCLGALCSAAATNEGGACGEDARGVCTSGLCVAPAVDAGVPADAGVMDGGAGTDAGVGDAGAGIDAGLVDAGAPVDAGTIDAGVMVADAGTVEQPDAGDPGTGGNGNKPLCAIGLGDGALWLAALVVLARRRAR